MPNYALSTRERAADIAMGMRVDRATAAVANGTNTLFNVIGGRILMTGLVGEVVADMAAGATTIRISPLTTDATAVVTHLSSAGTDAASDAAGIMYTLPAAVASGMTKSTGSSAAVCRVMPSYIVKTGAINLTAGAGNAGTWKWTVWYVPVDDGAYVEAA